MHPPRLAIPLLLLALAFPLSGAAQRFSPGQSAAAFDLHIERRELDVAYDDGSSGADLEITQLGIAFHERLSRSVRGTVSLGGTSVKQADRAALDAADPTGWFAGLDFVGSWPRTSRIRFAAGGQWQYSDADDTAEGVETVIDWHMAELRSAVIADLSPAVSLRLGAAQRWLDGDEEFDAASPSTTGFDLDRRWSGYLQLDFMTAPDGTIRFQARGGNPAGVRIAFERQY